MALERLRGQHRADVVLAALVVLLAIFGLVMIASSSVVTSYQKFGTEFAYVLRQTISFGMAIVVGLFAYLIDYRVWQRWAKALFWLILALLLAVYLPGIGGKFGGAHRWLDFGLFTVQSSEIVKLLLILYLAQWLIKRKEELSNFRRGFLPFAALLTLVAGLLIIQPDMGTMTIVVLIAVVMYFMAGAPLLHIFTFGLVGSALFLGLIKIAPYRMERWLTFLNPGQNTLESSYHITQALLAIGSGGLFGVGFGQSKEKYLYLPQAHTDSIFAITVEELGFLRALLIIGVFAWLGIRGFKIAKYAPDRYAQLVAIGITSWIVVQALINFSAMLALLPLTGVPLPFISYGGTALVAMFAAVGILLNISRHTALPQKR